MEFNETKGVLMYNRGSKCCIRALVALYTLRKHWNGEISFFLEEPYPREFEESCEYFGVKITRFPECKETKTLVRKTELFVESPYDYTLWIDSDTITLGPIDEMFEYLENYDVVIPHFAGWWSDGSTIGKRIKRYGGIAEQKFIDEALKHHPAINTGILSYRKNVPFMKDWIQLAQKGMGKMFIPDEVAFQVLYPSYQGIYIAPQKFNVSVRFGNDVEDKRIIHYHGQKHCMSFKLCDEWKSTFLEMKENNIANINYFVSEYPDRRFKRNFDGFKFIDGNKNKEDGDDKEFRDEYDAELEQINDKYNKDVTIVTACDEKYVEILRETFANWRKYKNIDEYPVIVFVHGVPMEDSRLDFLKLPNVRIVPWAMDNVETHREEMLSAFVFGAAENVKTDYWLKLDADSYATDNRPFIDDSMKQYDFCGHKWGYSRPEHIKKLDEWAKGHWKRKLRNAKPMIDDGKIEGNRFYHTSKRTISYIQLHKTKFTKFCVNLLKERRLPAPTQDTYMFFVANRFDPDHVGTKNFKKSYGFTQGKGKWGAEVMRQKLAEVDVANLSKDEQKPWSKDQLNEWEDNNEHHDHDSEENEDNIQVSVVQATMAPPDKTNRSFIVPEGQGIIIEIREI